MVDAVQGTLRGNLLIIEPRVDRSLCLDHLITIAPPDELESVLRKITLGLAMKERAGIEEGFTGWLFALAPEVAGYLLHGTKAPAWNVVALGVAVTEKVEGSSMPFVGAQPSQDLLVPTLFAVPIVRVYPPRISGVYWEFDWSRSDRNHPEMRAELFGLHRVERVGDLDDLAAGLRFAHAFQRAAAGGRPIDDSDIEAAIRAIAARGAKPTSKRVAESLYPHTNDPYDSLYKRLHGRGGRKFREVFSDLQRRALG